MLGKINDIQRITRRQSNNGADSVHIILFNEVTNFKGDNVSITKTAEQIAVTSLFCIIVYDGLTT